MKNLFIDCGGNLGQGYESISSQLNVNQDWDVIIFEPNPDCYNFLCERYNRPNIKIMNQAVYNSHGSIQFYIPKGDIHSVSSTIKNDFHNSLYDMVWDNSVTVETINLSDFIGGLNETHNVYLKLDIEGAEYDVLEQMMLDKTIDSIRHLFVEFHNQYISNEKLQEHKLDIRKNNIIQYLETNNIKYTIWH